MRAGDRLPGIPDHQFKFSVDYPTPWRVMVGLDVLYNAGQYLRGDESNQLAKLDGYALVNLRASYAVNQRLEIFTRVSNLFDTDYESFGLLGESPEKVLPGLADQRSLFVGAGAPRGPRGWGSGWVCSDEENRSTARGDAVQMK